MCSEEINPLPINLSGDGRRATLEVAAEELTLDGLAEFDAACRKLVETGRSELVLEMSRLSRIHSGFIGVLLFINAESSGRGATMYVVACEKIKSTIEQIAPGLVDIRDKA